MSLPRLDVPYFTVELPSNKQTVRMRPYLVREEKLLLMAQESNDPATQVEAVAQTIRNCTDGSVEPSVAPYFDVEFLLLQIRAKSVGEIVTPIYKCQNMVEDKRCGHDVDFRVDLNEIKASAAEGHSNTVSLSSNLKLHLRYPTIFTVSKIITAVESNDTAALLAELPAILDYVEEASTGKKYLIDDYGLDEQVAFIESFSPEHYEAVIKFVATMPSIRHTLNFKCGKCGFEQPIEMRGLLDFFPLYSNMIP